MPIIDTDVVKHVALLSRIELSDEELNTFTRQISDIIAYVDKLKEADTAGVAPMEHAPHDGENVLRCDDPAPSLPPDVALGHAPEKSAGHFRVPRVVE
ncbi:MAG TPA: Asp-tRNA(Asn)/Glu-tRNA(Gln) amidotransferase subunit GatC [Planctomycetes bacterium]|nr:Asp-tRNA(Asn)/Glu-tRNA(Gln) amidotransferase subunit GatC [Planctomycetota bacterium]